MHPSDDSTCNSIVVGAHILRLDMLNIALDEWKTLVVLVIVILRAHTFEICHHVPKIGVWFQIFLCNLPSKFVGSRLTNVFSIDFQEIEKRLPDARVLNDCKATEISDSFL